MNNDAYKLKYLKYKSKYNNLIKKQKGGSNYCECSFTVHELPEHIAEVPKLKTIIMKKIAQGKEYFPPDEQPRLSDRVKEQLDDYVYEKQNLIEQYGEERFYQYATSDLFYPSDGKTGHEEFEELTKVIIREEEYDFFREKSHIVGMMVKHIFPEEQTFKYGMGGYDIDNNWNYIVDSDEKAGEINQLFIDAETKYYISPSFRGIFNFNCVCE